jgi:uncharacterized protein (TIRG00374 family)
VARILVMLLLIGYVLHHAGLTTRAGWSALLATVKGSHAGFLLVSLVFTPVVYFQSIVKWHALTRARHMNVPLRRLWHFFVVGRFYNMVLPGNVGGDLFRIHMLAREAGGRYADATASVLVERLTGLVTLLACVFIAAGIASVRLHAPWLVYAVLLAAAAVALACWAVLHDGPMNMVTRAVAGRWRPVDRLLDMSARVRRSVLAFRDAPAAIAVAFAQSLVFYFLVVCNMWLTARVFDAGIGFTDMLVAVPIILFLMNIPASIGNIGIAEFAYTFVLAAFGMPPQAALSTALLMRAKQVIAAAWGGIAHAFSREELLPDFARNGTR